MSLTSLIFPISYNRAIALVDTDSEFRIKQFKVNNKDWYEKPKKFGEGYLIQTKYLTEDLVIKMNEAIFKGSMDGVCFRSGRRTGLSELG